MSAQHLRDAGAFKLRGLKNLALGDEPIKARRAMLQAVAQETLHALTRVEEMTDSEAERYAAEVIGCLKGALVQTGLLKKLPNPRFHRR